MLQKSIAILMLVLGIATLAAQLGAQPQGSAIQLTIEGAIGPATSDYVDRALQKAIAQGARLIIIRMDTPGGLDSSMRDIIKDILNSPIPVVTYVAPSGARAASAGTYILYASHIAAMAPATNLGAATPVQIGKTPGIEDRKEKFKGDKSKPDTSKFEQKDQHEKKPPEMHDQGDAMSRKVINDAVAYIRGLAKLRGRNEEWAERAVREAASLSAEDALKQNVINIVATNTADLLTQLDKRKVKVLDQEHVLHTTGLTIENISPDWRSRLLAVITNPNVAYILMLIGIYGLIFEFTNPGAILPGTVGAICLLLALFAFQLLPVNYAGIALILLGLILMVSEAFVPSFGALGIGGVIAFVIGSIILMDTDAPGFGISLALVGALAITSSLLFVFIIGMAIKARRRPVVSGREQLIDGVATALEDFTEQGRVRIHSEAWQARTVTPIKKGQEVKVTAVDGLTLQVTPQTEHNEEETS